MRFVSCSLFGAISASGRGAGGRSRRGARSTAALATRRRAAGCASFSILIVPVGVEQMDGQISRSSEP